MSSGDVRANLRRACEGIEDTCEDIQLPEEAYLRGIVEQLRYLVEGGQADPEMTAFPDPGALDTIGEELADVIAEVDGDAAVRLERARDEILLAISALDDRLEKQRGTRDDGR